jgi:hypothetical protein
VSKSLNSRMEFDHVIEVHADGSVTDTDLYAPGLYDGEVQSDDWTLMDGYSGQHSYSGPVMHPSEYIGGRLERDILAQPGFYVALVSYISTEAPEHDCPWRRTNPAPLGAPFCDVCDDAQEAENDADGWAVAFKESGH